MKTTGWKATRSGRRRSVRVDASAAATEGGRAPLICAEMKALQYNLSIAASNGGAPERPPAWPAAVPGCAGRWAHRHSLRRVVRAVGFS